MCANVLNAFDQPFEDSLVLRSAYQDVLWSDGKSINRIGGPYQGLGHRKSYICSYDQDMDLTVDLAGLDGKQITLSNKVRDESCSGLFIYLLWAADLFDNSSPDD